MCFKNKDLNESVHGWTDGWMNTRQLGQADVCFKHKDMDERINGLMAARMDG